MAYEIKFAESVKDQLTAFAARDRSKVLAAIEAQLVHEPLKKTRNRKPLRPNPLAPWELRVGKLRVFYDVAEAELKSVYIVAVGEKRGNKLFISGKEIEL